MTNFIEVLENMAKKVQGVNTGSIFIKQIEGDENTDQTTWRVIMPLRGTMMVRFDVTIVVETNSVSIDSVMFYERGFKDMERRALDGDR